MRLAYLQQSKKPPQDRGEWEMAAKQIRHLYRIEPQWVTDLLGPANTYGSPKRGNGWQNAA